MTTPSDLYQAALDLELVRDKLRGAVIILDDALQTVRGAIEAKARVATPKRPRPRQRRS